MVMGLNTRKGGGGAETKIGRETGLRDSCFYDLYEAELFLLKCC